jgi:hypothetical protein
MGAALSGAGGGPLGALPVAKLWPTPSSSALAVRKRVMVVFIRGSSWLGVSGTVGGV